MNFISGYENKYSIDKDGIVYSHISNKTIKPFLSKGEKGESKYLRVALYRNGKQNKYFIHRLVADTFIKKIEGKNFVNHIDGVKTNNNILNLEWCTLSENNYHAIQIGLASGYIGVKQKRNTSGFVGVTKCKNKWKSQIRYKNELIYLGLYESAKEASIAYQAKKEEILKLRRNKCKT